MIADTFTPLTGFLGGALIGLAAVTLLFLTGRIAGISGIVGGLLDLRASEIPWRLAFVLSLVGGAALASVAHIAPGEVHMQADGALLVIAGLAVGFGTRLGNGCTSGHGVCGLARGSGRSLIATITFMTSAIITATLVRHVF